MKRYACYAILVGLIACAVYAGRARSQGPELAAQLAKALAEKDPYAGE